MSCGVGCRQGSDLAWPWLWHRLAAAALTQSLAWELPNDTDMALKRLKGKKKIGEIHICCRKCGLWAGTEGAYRLVTPCPCTDTGLSAPPSHCCWHHPHHLSPLHIQAFKMVTENSTVSQSGFLTTPLAAGWELFPLRRQATEAQVSATAPKNPNASLLKIKLPHTPRTALGCTEGQ